MICSVDRREIHRPLVCDDGAACHGPGARRASQMLARQLSNACRSAIDRAILLIVCPYSACGTAVDQVDLWCIGSTGRPVACGDGPACHHVRPPV